MSNEKKNKDRDPAALINDSVIDRLVMKFLEINEVDYMRNVVIPVLENEGFEYVDFHHGNTEVGKDLIFYRDAGFGKKYLIAAVVKSDKLSKSSTADNGFPVILVQVSQALENEIICWDGVKRIPDKIFVILADNPSHDIISSNSGGYQKCIQKGAEFILGTDIAKSLIKNRMDIVEQLLESKLDSVEYFEFNSTNTPLMMALHNNDYIDIRSIFTDLDACVGSTSFRRTFSLKASGVDSVKISFETWKSVSKILSDFESVMGSVLNLSIDEICNNYEVEYIDASSIKNTKRWSYIEKTCSEIKSWIESSVDEFCSRVGDLIRVELNLSRVKSKNILVVRSVYAELQPMSSVVGDMRNKLQKIKMDESLDVCVSDYCFSLHCYYKLINKSKLLLSELLVSNLPHDLPPELIELMKFIDRNCKDAEGFISTEGKLNSNLSSFIRPPKYEVSFDFCKLDSSLKNMFSLLVVRYKSKAIEESREYARELLKDTHRFLSVIDSFYQCTELSSVLVFDDSQSNAYENIGACILSLLNSGSDILLTGNAGFGKSTTLEMFARNRYENKKLEEEIIFLPLAKISVSEADIENSSSLDIFYKEVARLFSPVQRGVTPSFVKNIIKNSKKLVLVLDGLDEALHLTPWIVNLIGMLRELKCGNLQVVASSRFIAEQLEDIGLFQIQLLPFQPHQVVTFVRNFLKNTPVLACEVIIHIDKYPSMYDVLKTPLMSTILCVLAKNGVVLPATKNALFQERFKLLWGAYDAKKQISRVKSSASCLEDVSKKVAYFLHTKRTRSATREIILENLLESLRNKYRSDTISLAFAELERPCNVLIEDVSNCIGFGHLTYQEYLVSEELYSNRQGDILAHLKDPWWREALVLMASKSEDIASIIDSQIQNYGEIGRAEVTLNAMIEVCSPSQQSVLKLLLQRQKKLDHYSYE